MKVSKEEISKIAESIGTDYASLMAFISVESGGSGFDPKTGKIIIQFEPSWFRRLAIVELKEYQRLKIRFDSGKILAGAEKKLLDNWNKVLANKVEGQVAEWLAFNAAFAINPRIAMLSTSIGLMQIMGFNFDSCGFKTVNEMWDDFKTGEAAQIRGGAEFIKSKNLLHEALLNRNWSRVAYYYNGSNYAVNKYDIKMEAAHKRYSA